MMATLIAPQMNQSDDSRTGHPHKTTIEVPTFTFSNQNSVTAVVTPPSIPVYNASHVPVTTHLDNKPLTPCSSEKVPTPASSQRSTRNNATPSGTRLNKFVRRLHDMLQAERNSGVVEWRRGLLVLHSTDAFAKTILPRYFNTKNFKTFRRQLNYYGFVHVRSFSTTGSTTTALWVNRDLAKHGTGCVSSVLMLKRVEPCDSAKTVEGRRVRKELAVDTVENDIGVSAKSLQLEQIRSMTLRRDDDIGLSSAQNELLVPPPSLVSMQPQLAPQQVHQQHSTQDKKTHASVVETTSPPKLEQAHQEKPRNETTNEADNQDAAYLLLMLSKPSTS